MANKCTFGHYFEISFASLWLQSQKDRDLQSLDFIVNRFFMKLFCTKYMSVVKCCQQMFHVELKSDIIKNRSVVKFESKCDILSVSQVYFLFLVKGFLCLLCYLCGESR